MLLELIPLIAKDFFDVEEYFHLAASEKEGNTTLAKIKNQNSLSKESAILMNENVLEVVAQKSNARLLKMQQEIAFAKAVMKETEQNMDEFERIDQHWQKKYPQLYPIYGFPVMQNAYAAFASSTRQVFE
jgi:hypothetical protein